MASISGQQLAKHAYELCCQEKKSRQHFVSSELFFTPAMLCVCDLDVVMKQTGFALTLNGDGVMDPM